MFSSFVVTKKCSIKQSVIKVYHHVLIMIKKYLFTKTKNQLTDSRLERIKRVSICKNRN